MPQFSRTRTTFARALAVGALTAAVGGSLVACGSDDSTASSTPEQTTSAASESAAPSSKAEDKSSSPVTSPSEAATAPPETPESVPSEFPGPTEVPVSAEGQKFLDELENRGLTPAGDGQIAISAGDFICASKEQGKPDAETLVFLTPMVGSDAAASGKELSPVDAAAQAQVYIDAADAVYCK